MVHGSLSPTPALPSLISAAFELRTATRRLQGGTLVQNRLLFSDPFIRIGDSQLHGLSFVPLGWLTDLMIRWSDLLNLSLLLFSDCFSFMQEWGIDSRW